jgi:hypothetical protein
MGRAIRTRKLYRSKTGRPTTYIVARKEKRVCVCVEKRKPTEDKEVSLPADLMSMWVRERGVNVDGGNEVARA